MPRLSDVPQRRFRRVSDEERALWRTVNRETRRFREPAKAAPVPTLEPTTPVATSALALGSETPSPVLRREALKPESPGGGFAVFRPKDGDIDALHDSTPGLDRKTARALRKGRRDPDARIDLHGMTLDRAHEALVRFIHAARASGARCVLVITGKGGDYRARLSSGDGFRGDGVLRRDVPRWLRTAPLSGAVTGIYSAHGRHGGEGALYVYLRKSRG